MLRINYLAVDAASVAFFGVGALWYSPLLFGKAYMKLRGIAPVATTNAQIPVGGIISELVRGLVVAYVLARLLILLGGSNWLGAMQPGLWLWIGFPVMILLSSVIHENVPWPLAAIHSGDWLAKIILMTVLLGLWR